MDNNEGMISCTIGCWLVALLGGALAAVLLMVLGGWGFMQGVFMGLVVAAVAGALLSWIICKPLPAIGEATTEAAKTDAAPTPTAKAAPAAAGTDATAAAEIKPSTPLPGEDDLAARKGEWKYEAEQKPKAKAKDKPKAKPAAKKKADAPAAADEGTKPETLSAAREGGPDNLKEIKGVGPKLEALLHSMGFYHFDQVASWGADEVAWVDQNLEGFKGRVTRDDWVAQAKILAAGGETEFSKKVDKGGVY
ncbi:endonuclease [Tateyamaria omphalii]|uniref:endonuclease n=1 Tax=Tateyamaria omphalii TaxID=299262 RepID=UPI001C9A1069|nr:endonuclease [Tateyamaria omphalii]MBY5932230.1 endonuclease [Tateyamaria omphalii]